MAEHHSGPVETGAPMDYSEHEKTYILFLNLTKWVVVFCIALLIAMAAAFFGNVGFITSTILFVILTIAGVFALR